MLKNTEGEGLSSSQIQGFIYTSQLYVYPFWIIVPHLLLFDTQYVPESEDLMFVFVLALFVLKIRLGTHLVRHRIFNALYLLAYNDLHPVSTNTVLYKEEMDCNSIRVLDNIQALSITLTNEMQTHTHTQKI